MRFLFLLVVVFNSSLFAQQFPRLLVTMEKEVKPIQLSRVDIDVKILGQIAETRTTLTFHNPNSQILEGNLNFPLPQGATVSGYALDVNGVMVDGVAVEKHEARRVFEREERKGVDPGLIEWVQGNNFRTRIYPIPVNGNRTVMIRYLSEVNRASGRSMYHLPLQFPEKVSRFHMRMEATQAAAPPVVVSGSLANFGFSVWRNCYVAETTLNDVTLKEDLLIGLPDVETIPVQVEKNASGEYQFAINEYEAASFTPSLGKGQNPSRITLYWDASGSRCNVDHNREYALLEKLFIRWKATPVEVRLILFRNRAEPARRFHIINGESKKLLDTLRATDYDGGTQMAAISPPPDGIVPDFYLLLTDGLSNFGNEKPSGFKASLYPVSTSLISNHSFLSWLAQGSGGQYFNLALLDEKAIADSIGRPAYCFMAARYDPALIQETYPNKPEPVHGRFTLAGKLVAPIAEITLEFGAEGHVLKTAKYVIRRKNASSGELLNVFWAQKKIEALSVFPDSNREKLISIGKKYGMVTPSTSLLVLERLAQYVEYKITPPIALPEMRKEYMERIAELKDEEKENKKDKLQNIWGLWAERMKWWETDYSKIAPAKKKDVHSESAGSGGGVGHGVGPSAPSQPPAPAGGQNPVNTPLGNNAGANPAREHLVLESAASVGTVLPEEKLVELPLVSSNVLDRIKMMGGANLTSNPDGGADASTFAGISAANVNLQRDGVTVNDVRWGTGLSSPVRANPELIGEFKLGTAPVDAEMGRGSGQVQVVTRSGSADKNETEDASVEIDSWDPKTPYIEELKKSRPEKYWKTYMDARKSYGALPAVYLDCADFFVKHKRSDLGIQILSNIAELQLENPALLRILAHRLAELGQSRLSIQLFEKILKMRPEEPQSYRDLALVLAEQKKYKRAMELLSHVVMNEWDRFEEIELMALMELNRIIPLARAQGISIIPLDPRLIRLLDVDIRIVLTWDADMTDVDLWVTEPSGEKAYYENHLTAAGGHVSKDFMDGYGPEEYVIRKARPGKYLIQTNYFGNESPTYKGPVTVQADIYTNYGRETEKRQRLTLRLDEEKDTFTIGEIGF